MIRRAVTHVRQALVAGSALVLLAMGGAPVRAEQWNGVYIGAFAGGAWGGGEFASYAGVVDQSSYFSSDRNIALVERNSSGKARSSAFTGGIQLGANQRFNQIVVGAEVDFGAFDLNGSRGAVDASYAGFAGIAYTVRASYSTDWLLTARGRLGWLASPNMLLYFTGGLALSDVKASNEFFDRRVVPPLVFGARGSSSHTRTTAGYTLGGGIEADLGGPWSVKAEYLYVDLGKVSTHATIVGPGGLSNPLDTSVDVTANIARVGITYRLGE